MFLKHGQTRKANPSVAKLLYSFLLKTEMEFYTKHIDNNKQCIYLDSSALPFVLKGSIANTVKKKLRF